VTICLSISGRGITRAAAPATELLVGTVDGIVRLTRERPGTPWQPTDRWLDGQQVNALTLEPTRGLLFAATQDAGIHVSADGGRTWQRRDHGIAELRVWSLNYAEAPDGLRLYAGTEPAHLYVSTDYGERWTELAALRAVPSVDEWFFPGEPDRGHVKFVNADPTDPDTLYACIEVGGVLKSTDGGRTWRELTGFYKDVHRLLPLAFDPRHLYMATGEGIYESFDAGDTWTYLGRSIEGIMYADPLVIHPERESVIFFAGAMTNPRHWNSTHETTSRFVKSADGGATWQVLGPGLPDPIAGSVEALALQATPAGCTVVAATTEGELFSSDDEGATWTVLTGLPGVGKDRHVAMLTPALAS
jgi:photosystem II stability/assembly factor-like uncharacterized protein